MIDWQPRVRALVQELAAQGQLTDARWIEAFANVPRHVFVPRFYGEDHAVVDGEVSAPRDSWLDAVYQDSTLVTQIAPVPGTDLLRTAGPLSVRDDRHGGRHLADLAG